jgi:hypothetical protein
VGRGARRLVRVESRVCSGEEVEGAEESGAAAVFFPRNGRGRPKLGFEFRRVLCSVEWSKASRRGPGVVAVVVVGVREPSLARSLRKKCRAEPLA